MIQSFRDRDTERIFSRQAVKRLRPDLQRAARAKLLLVDAATTLEDLRIPPGNRIGALAGDRAGQHSIRINRQWRVCFVWKDGHAWDVELVDYH